MKENTVSTQHLLCRLLLALAIIVIAAALRIAPHPWNFTPIGAMALFSGALVRESPSRVRFPAPHAFPRRYFHRLLKKLRSELKSETGGSMAD